MTFWVLFTGICWVLALFLLGRQGLKEYWPAGLVAMLVVYLFDSTGTQFGAYRFYHTPLVNGVPVLYLLAVLALGMLTLRFYPRGHREQLLYISILAGAFLVPELIMLKAGNFQHLRGWHWGKSYLLNICGFIIITWTSTRLGVRGAMGQWPFRKLLR